MDESITPEIRDELSRARNLIGLEFVAKMKLKLKETALRRMEVEKTSVDAEVEDEEVRMPYRPVIRSDSSYSSAQFAWTSSLMLL